MLRETSQSHCHTILTQHVVLLPGSSCSQQPGLTLFSSLHENMFKIGAVNLTIYIAVTEGIRQQLENSGSPLHP